MKVSYKLDNIDKFVTAMKRALKGTKTKKPDIKHLQQLPPIRHIRTLIIGDKVKIHYSKENPFDEQPCVVNIQATPKLVMLSEAHKQWVKCTPNKEDLVRILDLLDSEDHKWLCNIDKDVEIIRGLSIKFKS